MNNEFNKIPNTTNDIGINNFLKIPFYKRNNNVDVIYINHTLYEKIFQKKYNYDEAKTDIIERFSVTLNNTGDIIGYGYVDKQADPTDIALNGNKGSGRAFYLYENCNIKGEKTPFATSPRDDYNNGKYSLDCAIQECIISNVLNKQNDFNNFETLAIIDTHEEFLFPHTNEKLPCGLIIRYYKDKELYRFSHRFVNNKSFTKRELIEISHKIGELEGNKFIKRFLHGAWSIGNLSIESNMIDLDTSFFVIGRHPQWSFTDKYITNYFGFEQKGQIKVLETILNSKLNIDNITLDEITKIIEKQKTDTIRKKFPILLGYNQSNYQKYSKYFNKLADEFSNLSQLIFDNYDNLNCLDKNCQNTYLFNFSNFFRYYEVAKQKGIWNKQYGLNLLLNKNAMQLEYKYNNEEYYKKLLSFFENITINNEKKYLNAINRALLFIEEFDKLNELIDNNENIDKKQKLIKSYLENEDKIYLTARKWIRGELISIYNKKGSKYVNNIINTIIDFYSDKDYSKDKFLCDLIIYEEGILFKEINKNGYHRYCLKLFNKINNKEIILHTNTNNIILNSKDFVNFNSNYFENINLSKINNISISINKIKTPLTEIGKDISLESKYIEFIYNQSDTDVITNYDIKILLKENYNIEVKEIKKMTGGTTDCYCIYTSENKYFLKVFEKNKNINSLILEHDILKILNENKFPIANIIQSCNNKIALLYKEHLVILQEFIEGTTFHKSCLPKDTLLESAALLGKMHKILHNKFRYDNPTLFWTTPNIEKERKEIDYLIKLIENIKTDKNYDTLKKSLNYKKNMLQKVYKYCSMFNNLTFSITHGDYSKRQLITNNNKITAIIDFSCSDILPISWELIRSYFLSTQSCYKNNQFDLEQFCEYIKVYLKQFDLNNDDLKAMPYIFLYQLILSKYGYNEYIEETSNKEEIIDYITWKDNICIFLEKNIDNIEKKIKENIH